MPVLFSSESDKVLVKSVSFDNSKLLRKTSSELLIKSISPEAPRKNQGGWYIAKRTKSDVSLPIISI